MTPEVGEPVSSRKAAMQTHEHSLQTNAQRPLVLASASVVRQQLLTAVGLTLDVVPADVDERAIERSASESKPHELAVKLATAKAKAVSVSRANSLVIGCDQVLVFGETILHKAKDQGEAKAKLHKLQGQTHTLISAGALSLAGSVLWSGFQRVDLLMRAMSSEEIDAYLDGAGDAVTGSVGAYHLEGRGAALFERIEGDYFAVLGIPMLPLLAALRDQGIDPAIGQKARQP
ncbi:MAG: Maf family nucleotide pyrophosphatase [Pseudomonadota bacterium]